MNKITGVYALHRTDTEQVYIGSSKDIKRRWSNHKAKMSNGRHYHQELNEGWQRGTIRFEILEECSVDDLKGFEQRWINYFNAVGFNVLNRIAAGETHTDSAIGRQHKSEAQRGAHNGNAKLNTQQVQEIRQKYDSHEATIKALAQEYGVCTSHAWRICNGARWNGAVL